MRNNGIEQEVIDILQVVLLKSIFARHYYKPDFLNNRRANDCINSLYGELTKS